MKVFLSHSGEGSKALAIDLQKFIRKLVRCRLVDLNGDRERLPVPAI
jgi:hypothetical protein